MKKRDWRELHQFWFGNKIEITHDYYQKYVPRWFYGNNPIFDQVCREKFSHWLKDFKLSNFDHWLSSPGGYVSLVILLDQIPRNAFRGTSQAFDFDPIARELTLKAIETTIEVSLTRVEKLFLYLPLEHAEDGMMQSLSVKKFIELNYQAPEEIKEFTKLSMDKAIEHQEIIHLYGRFHGRDLALGRDIR